MPYVTAIYAAVLGLLLLVLAARVTVRRRGARVGLGTGGDSTLERAVRVHGNFTENVPLALLLLLAAELNGAPYGLLHLCGLALVLGRLLHALGLSRQSGTSFGRFWGTALTWLVILVLVVLNLWLGLARLFMAAQPPVS